MPATSRRVTLLESDRRIPGNIIVELDGRRFTSLPAQTVTALGLQERADLDDAQFERLQHAADVEAAYIVAVRILTAMPRAVEELKRRLRQRGHKASIAAEAVGRLEEAGVLDDGRFAEYFTRSRLARGHGPPRILTDLLSRGVERRLAEHSIAEVLESEGVDTNDKARALAEKRAGQLGDDLPADARRRRVLAYLGRRGFRGYEVTEIVDEVLAAVES
jgi:regulatory protein